MQLIYNPDRTGTHPPVIDVFEKYTDGSKWGVSDFYSECEAALQAALDLGPDLRWTTGWWGAKKEIVSGKITAHGDGNLWLEVSVSDDFDTPGSAETVIPFTNSMDTIEATLDALHDEAEQNRRDNQVYAGFCVFNDRGQWIETYIQCLDYDYDSPPGDNYYKWGWQEEWEEIPPEVLSTFEEWLGTWEWTKKPNASCYAEDEYGNGYTLQRWGD